MVANIRPKTPPARRYLPPPPRFKKVGTKMPKKLLKTNATTLSKEKQKERQRNFKKRKLTKKKSTRLFEVALKFFSKRKKRSLPKGERKFLMRYKA